MRDLLEKGDNLRDPEMRKEAYGKALKLIAERAYAVPLYSLPTYTSPPRTSISSPIRTNPAVLGDDVQIAPSSPVGTH